MKLLHIDSSILGPNSVSRQVSAQIVERQLALNPGLEVIYRDLAADGSAHLTGAHMAAWQGALVEDAALNDDLAKGGTYIDELFAADIIVIGAPMYNFTVPTQLKAWIDRVVVAGKTFRYSETGTPVSLLPSGKKVFIASSRGGAAYGEGAPAAFLEHHETYLKGVLGFIGLTDVTVIRAEGVAMGPDARQAALAGARQAIDALAA
jgi:FMN-dependent NADH-azoreductase